MVPREFEPAWTPGHIFSRSLTGFKMGIGTLLVRESLRVFLYILPEVEFGIVYVLRATM